MGQIIAALPDRQYVSAISKAYLVSYILGVLVRYFPSRWMALIRNQKGDAVLPLLRAAIVYVEEQFPQLALSILK